MIVLVLRKVRPGLRGKLTRWLIQPQSGLFIGHPSGRIRDRIWQLVCDAIDLRGGSAIMIHPASNEQGYTLRTRGEPDKIMADFDGLILPKTPLRGR